MYYYHYIEKTKWNKENKYWRENKSCEFEINKVDILLLDFMLLLLIFKRLSRQKERDEKWLNINLPFWREFCPRKWIAYNQQEGFVIFWYKICYIKKKEVRKKKKKNEDYGLVYFVLELFFFFSSFNLFSFSFPSLCFFFPNQLSFQYLSSQCSLLFFFILPVCLYLFIHLFNFAGRYLLSLRHYKLFDIPK